MMTKKKISFKDAQPTEIVAILDRSGSMYNLVKDSIGGYNTFLETQKKADVSANLTTILFDHEYMVVEDRVPVKQAKGLTSETYKPRGNTALNDAIGKAILKLKEINPEKAIVVILTDGQENASKEFNITNIKDLIKECETKGWEVLYLAANQDAFAVGDLYGFKYSNTANAIFSDQLAYAKMYRDIGTLAANYTSTGSLGVTSVSAAINSSEDVKSNAS